MGAASGHLARPARCAVSIITAFPALIDGEKRKTSRPLKRDAVGGPGR